MIDQLSGVGQILGDFEVELGLLGLLMEQTHTVSQQVTEDFRKFVSSNCGLTWVLGKRKREGAIIP